MTAPRQMAEELIFDTFSVNLTNGVLERNGTPVNIEPKPFQALDLLLRQPGRIVRHEDFKAALWPDVKVEVGDNLATQINKLRKALGESRQKSFYILTKQGEGYQFNPRVRVERRCLNVDGDVILGQNKSPVTALSHETDHRGAGPDSSADSASGHPLVPANTLPSTRGRIRTLILGSAVVGCLLAAAAWWRAGKVKLENPIRLKVEGSVLTSIDRNNRAVWSYPLPNAPDDHQDRLNAFVDLDGDGRRELLYVYWPPPSEIYEPMLYCLNPDGKVRWTWKPGRTVKTPLGREYSGPFRFSLLGVLKHARKDGGRIVVGSHHPVSWPFQVALLTASGDLVSEYWHPGWFFSMKIADVDGDGLEEVLLGGTNDSYTEMLEEGKNYRATLVVLDSRRMDGHGVAASGDDRVIVGIPPGREKAVLLFRALTSPREKNVFYSAAIDAVSENRQVRVLLSANGHPLEPFTYLDLDQRLHLVNTLVTVQIPMVVEFGGGGGWAQAGAGDGNGPRSLNS